MTLYIILALLIHIGSVVLEYIVANLSICGLKVVVQGLQAGCRRMADWGHSPINTTALSTRMTYRAHLQSLTDGEEKHGRHGKKIGASPRGQKGRLGI